VKKLALALTLISFNSYADITPNTTVTPGKADPTLTTQVICDPKWSTKTVRNVTQSTKKKAYANYNVQNHQGYCSGTQGCEVDHLISLQLGGSNDITNLWPQPFEGAWNARDKDKLENKLHDLICSGKVPQSQAQHDISTDWIGAFKKYGLTK